MSVSTVSERWLHALQRLADRAAHEIRNPLNGAVVNLEVVRHRAARPGADPAAIVSFAEAAAGELERATELVEALLALARSPGTPIDLWSVLRPLAALFSAIVASEGGRVSVDRPTDVSVETAADGEATRFALAATLEAMVAKPTAVRCTIERLGGELAVHLRGDAGAPAIPESVRIAIAGAGVELRDAPYGITLLFSALERGGTTT